MTPKTSISTRILTGSVLFGALLLVVGAITTLAIMRLAQKGVTVGDVLAPQLAATLELELALTESYLALENVLAGGALLCLRHEVSA